MDEFIALPLSILSGVIVSLVTLWLAGRQKARQERQTEARRRSRRGIAIDQVDT